MPARSRALKAWGSRRRTASGVMPAERRVGAAVSAARMKREVRWLRMGREGEGEVQSGAATSTGAGGAGVGGGVGKEGEVEDEVAEEAGAEPDEGEAVLPCVVEFPAVAFEPLGECSSGEPAPEETVDGQMHGS